MTPITRKGPPMVTGTPRPVGGLTIYVTTIAGRQWVHAAPIEVIDKKADQ